MGPGDVRRGRRAVAAVLLTALTTVHATAGDSPPEVPAPAPAYQVIVRGAETLPHALRLAGAAAWRDAAQQRDVVVVIDPTTAMAMLEEEFVAALVALDQRDTPAINWRLAVLGAAPAASVAVPSQLAPRLAGNLVPREIVVDAVTALRATAESAERGSVLVYVADEHFEDERDVESLAALLVERGLTLSVAGPEAAFQRGWNDGFFPPYRGVSRAGAETLWYDPHIGRDPIAQPDDGPAWHGGETAFPMLPTHFGMHFDERLFTTRTVTDPKTRKRERRVFSHAYPAGWGPWSLMRLAAVTGGRYVTWSTRRGQPAVVYDGSKLDALAPDLRERDTIVRALARRPLRATTLRVWGEMTDATSAVFRSTPPVRSNLSEPIPMVEPRPTGRPDTIMYERSDHARFLHRAPALLRLIDTAVRRMDRAIERAPPPVSDATRRDLADARFLVHVLRCERFSWGEAFERGRRLMPRPWRREDELVPALHPVTLTGQDARREQFVRTDVEVADEARWTAVLAERRFLIDAYGGTPWGEMIARNGVDTYRLLRVRLGSGVSGQSGDPFDSEPQPPDVTPSGGTSGPSTGD